ncbi:MAG: hypothetical protein KC656_32835 [Myxococcales bacterium]|nr:hypothetical protein [Myxococcales bacterium]
MERGRHEVAPSRAPWSTVAQSTLAFATAGAVIAGYGLVLQPAWFAGSEDLPSSDVVIARMASGALLGAVVGFAVGALRRAVPGPWSLYGTLSGLVLAAAVHVEIVANPRFPRPWMPAVDGRVSLTGEQVGTVSAVVDWMAHGGWVALLLGLAFGVIVALWQDADQPDDPSAASPTGTW